MSNGTFTIFDTDALLNPDGVTPDTDADPGEENLVRKMIRQERERKEALAKEKLRRETEASAKDVTMLDIDGEDLFEYGEKSLIGREDYILDSDWSKHAFADMTPPTDADQAISFFKIDFDDILDPPTTKKEHSYYRSSADYKFEDSSLGGAVGVGSKPQYCRYSDVRAKGLTVRDKTTLDPLKPSTSGLGMGRFYSEQIDDNQQLLFMRFGVVEFNSLGYFFNTLIKSDMRSLFSHGQASSVVYNTTKLIGNALILYRHPLGLLGMFVLTDVAKVVVSKRSRFYNIKPTMYIYWNIVYVIVNQIMANTHFQDSITIGAKSRTGSVEAMDGIGEGGGAEQIEDVLQLMGLRMHKGRIDVVSTINRVTMQYNKYLSVLSEEEKTLSPSTVDITKDYLSEAYKSLKGFVKRESYPVIESITEALYKSPLHHQNDPTPLADETVDQMNARKDPPKRMFRHETESVVSDGEKKNSGIMDDSTLGLISAEVSSGSAFAIFKVDSVKEYTETFSNSTKQSATAGSLNGIASTSRTLQHTIAGGNIGDSPLARLASASMKLVLNSVGGLVNGLTLNAASGIKGVLSGIEVDIPDEWEGSTTSLPEAKYTMNLQCLYNNPISMLTGIYFPLSMLLAGTLPMQTGPRSNTSPLLCESYLRGGVYKTLGIIKSLQITRGGGNLGFDAHGAALRLKIDITIQDLSTVITAPLVSNQSYLLPGYDLGNDSALSEYLSVLSGLSIYDELFPIPSITRRLNANVNNLSHLLSGSNAISYFGKGTVGNIFKAIATTQKGIAN